MRKWVPVVVLVGLVVMLGAGCSRVKSDPLPPPVTEDPVETYRIAPGDVLSIDGGKNPQVTKEQAYVDQEGFVSLLYLGKVKASGKTKSELERDIDNAYREAETFTDSQVSVTVLTLYYFIDGQVQSRGRRQYVRQVTLYQAIVEAGGFSEYADRGDVRVLRPQPDGTVKVYVINCRRIMDGRDADSFVVRPNDTILVPRGY
jgi:protein involved in polysaccharide export with SLBB domain